MALYETEDGRPITTQSMIKTFRMCPREAMYKYHDRLKPKIVSKPLTRGKWVHSLLEEHYKGGDWRIPHAQLTAQFSKLFDEEKEHLGDLPRELDLLMESYFWHYGDPKYKDHRWTVHEVEKLIEADMPSGHLFRGKVDMIGSSTTKPTEECLTGSTECWMNSPLCTRGQPEKMASPSSGLFGITCLLRGSRSTKS